MLSDDVSSESFKKLQSRTESKRNKGKSIEINMRRGEKRESNPNKQPYVWDSFHDARLKLT